MNAAAGLWSVSAGLGCAWFGLTLLGPHPATTAAPVAVPFSVAATGLLLFAAAASAAAVRFAHPLSALGSWYLPIATFLGFLPIPGSWPESLRAVTSVAVLLAAAEASHEAAVRRRLGAGPSTGFTWELAKTAALVAALGLAVLEAVRHVPAWLGPPFRASIEGGLVTTGGLWALLLLAPLWLVTWWPSRSASGSQNPIPVSDFKPNNPGSEQS